MLILITGVPGSGKTLYGVGLIRQFLTDGREVFTNIDGLTLPGCLPAPEDWREAPDGSVVVYDECQQKFGPDGNGRSGRSDIQDLEIHRHRGMDIMLITQHPKLLHAHIRRLVGRHHHVFRMYGAQTAKVFSRDGQIDVDKASALRNEDSVMWTYPKADFEVYKSATVHTHKRHLPAWLKRMSLGILVGFGLLGLVGYQARAFFSGNLYGEEKNQQQEEQKLNQDYEFTFIPEPIPEPQPLSEIEPEIASKGCITAPNYCACISMENRRLKMDYEQCLTYAAAYQN